MSKVRSLAVTPMQGGFLVKVFLDEGQWDEYIVPTYAKVLKAVKSELVEFKPVRKPRAPKEVV